MYIIPCCFLSPPLFLSPFYHSISLFTLHWEVVDLTSFRFSFSSFSSLLVFLPISISVLVFSRCAVMDVTLGVQGNFNLPLLTKTIQLACCCLSNLRTALVKCYLWYRSNAPGISITNMRDNSSNICFLYKLWLCEKNCRNTNRLERCYAGKYMCARTYTHMHAHTLNQPLHSNPVMTGQA